MKELHFINIFRALAAFWVLAAHCAIWGGWNGLHIPDPKIAVDLFMIVSGFLMAANTSARRNFEPLEVSGNRVRFWVRRYFRIAPAYYLSIAAIVVLSPIVLTGTAELQALNRNAWPIGGHNDPSLVRYTLANIAMHVTFLFGLFPKYSSSMALPDWSLGLEMQFYFAFPFIALFLMRNLERRVMVVAAAFFIAGHFYAQRVWYPEPSLLLFKLQYFLAGMLLFHALQAHAIPRIAIALVLVSLEAHYGRWHFLSAGLLLSMFALGLMERDGTTPVSIRRIAGLAKFPADVSYSVYLFHGLAIGAFGWLTTQSAWLHSLSAFPRTMLMFAFVLPVTYSLAAVVYRNVEVPGVKLGRLVLRNYRFNAGPNSRGAGVVDHQRE